MLYEVEKKLILFQSLSSINVQRFLLIVTSANSSISFFSVEGNVPNFFQQVEIIELMYYCLLTLILSIDIILLNYTIDSYTRIHHYEVYNRPIIVDNN